MNPQSYLDHRNIALWNEVSERFNIALHLSPDLTYGLYTIRNEATIYVPSDAPCKDSFTHELLHLLLDKKEIYITSSLKIQFQDPVFFGVFKSDLSEHIGNCLNHVKILPLYLALGFDRRKFIFDYDQNKYTDTDHLLIESFFKAPGRRWGEVANLYVAKFFAMKACPNEEFDYTAGLASLKKLDPLLYQILGTFWNAWEQFDINVDDPIYNNYHLFDFEFISTLKDWVIQKRVEGFS